MRSTSTTTTAPPHRRRCLAPAARRRRLAQRVCRRHRRSAQHVAIPAASRPTPPPPPTTEYPPTPTGSPSSTYPQKTRSSSSSPYTLQRPCSVGGRHLPDPVDHGQRERPQLLEQPHDPRPHNPSFERLKRKRSLRPVKPPCRQFPNTYASVTTCAPVNPPSRRRKHRTCPHVLFSPRSAPVDRTDDEDVATSSKLVRWSGGPVRFFL